MTTDFRFGQRSSAQLTSVHPDLQRVVRRALEISRVDFAVIEGRRSPERQKKLYAIGRTTPGDIVTWAIHSRHETGHAIDLGPTLPNGNIDWNDLAGFKEIYRAMMAASKETTIPVRSGWDWDQDGLTGEKGESDLPHYELPRGDYP